MKRRSVTPRVSSFDLHHPIFMTSPVYFFFGAPVIKILVRLSVPFCAYLNFLVSVLIPHSLRRNLWCHNGTSAIFFYTISPHFPVRNHSLIHTYTCNLQYMSPTHRPMAFTPTHCKPSDTPAYTCGLQYGALNININQSTDSACISSHAVHPEHATCRSVFPLTIPLPLCQVTAAFPPIIHATMPVGTRSLSRHITRTFQCNVGYINANTNEQKQKWDASSTLWFSTSSKINQSQKLPKIVQYSRHLKKQ